jgi:hypothetical protein
MPEFEAHATVVAGAAGRDHLLHQFGSSGVMASIEREITMVGSRTTVIQREDGEALGYVVDVVAVVEAVGDLEAVAQFEDELAEAIASRSPGSYILPHSIRATPVTPDH